MPSPFFGRHLCSAGLALLLAGAWPAGVAEEPAAEKMLSPADLAALERENGMWRLVRVDEDVPANLARLAKAGFTHRETADLSVKLAALWEIPVDRNFGWLREETVAQIGEVDRGFVVRMRAARLFEATGVRRGGAEPVSVRTLTQLWRAAILKVLDYDELAEFRLMNSAAARQLTGLVKDLPVTDDELRTLFEWQRDFAGTHPVGPAFASQPAWQREEQLDQWRRIRDLLGDPRFATYLSRANPVFARMRQALEDTGPVSPTAALDLWWLRQRDGWARDQEHAAGPRDELTARMKTKAAALLGGEQADKYAAGPDGRWLTIPARVVVRRPAPSSSKP